MSAASQAERVFSRTLSEDRTYWLIVTAVIVVTLPVRLARMSASLWLDETWVANSLLAPSLHDLFYSSLWTQSTPPLFLLIERSIAHTLGISEVPLRLLPAAAGIAGIVLTALALRRFFSSPAVALSITVLCCDYWLIKYSQQVKQYATDFLVSAALIYLMSRYLRDGSSAQRLRALLAAAVVGMFLSYTAVFLLPSIVICAGAGLANGPSGLTPAAFSWRRAALASVVLGSFLLIEYVLFIKPSLTAAQIDYFRDCYPDPRHPLVAAYRVVGALGDLLVAFPGLGVAAGAAIAAGVIYAAKAAFSSGDRNSSRARVILLLAVMPVMCTTAAGLLQRYPVFEYPRLLLFLLPGLVMILAWIFELLCAGRAKSMRVPIAAAACGAVLFSQIVYFHSTRPTEDNRGAVALLQSRMKKSDVLYVHGDMYEQFKYYRRLLAFDPADVVVGNVDWPPCCATGDRDYATYRQTTSLADDLNASAAHARGRGLWIITPGGDPTHYSGVRQEVIERIPDVLQAQSCRLELRRAYQQTLVEAFSCL